MRQQDPHDVTDLRLAPVALLIDHRLQELAALGAQDLADAVVFGANQQPHTPEERGRAVVATATHMIDLGGWRATWDPRGVRLSHHDHTLVLGASRGLHDYVTGTVTETVGGTS